MGNEQRKTEAYERGLKGLNTQSVLGEIFGRTPSKDEYRANQEGKRERARIKAWKGGCKNK